MQPSAKDNQINQIKSNSEETSDKSNFNTKSNQSIKAHTWPNRSCLETGDVILHVGTNDASFCNSSEVVNNILKLRLFISQKLPNANIILSKPIIRSDTAAGKVTIEEVNKQLNDFDFDMIDNNNFLEHI